VGLGVLGASGVAVGTAVGADEGTAVGTDVGGAVGAAVCCAMEGPVVFIGAGVEVGWAFRRLTQKSAANAAHKSAMPAINKRRIRFLLLRGEMAIRYLICHYSTNPPAF